MKSGALLVLTQILSVKFIKRNCLYSRFFALSKKLLQRHILTILISNASD